jgi:hypothetical protein
METGLVKWQAGAYRIHLLLFCCWCWAGGGGIPLFLQSCLISATARVHVHGPSQDSSGTAWILSSEPSRLY